MQIIETFATILRCRGRQERSVNMAVTQPGERIKVWRPQGFAGVEVECFENSKDLVLEPFVLQSYDITVVLQGDCKLGFAGETYRWENVNHLFLAQYPNEGCTLDTRSERHMSVWTLRLFPEAMTSLLGSLGQADKPIYFPEMTAADALNAPLASLLKETVGSFDEPAGHLERETRLIGLIHAVLTHCADTPPPEVKLGKEHKAVTLVKEVVQAHVEQELRLEHLAQITDLSKHYLLRVFMRDVGLSPHEYQMGLRVNRSKYLLAKGEKPAEVALDLGFSDQAHLTRTFKRYTRTTPGRFRKLSLAG